MDRLIDGYRRFRTNIWSAERARYEELSREGQSPPTMVVACSDSRVDPATVFGAVPGELFTVRNVAGLVPPFTPDAGYHGTSAALEYGVRVLKVDRVVVLGHAQCGGVRAMIEGAGEARDFVEPWMAIAEPVLRHARAEATGEDIFARCEDEVVRLSLANLMSFPWIADAVGEGRLVLQGFRFAIKTGVLARLEGETFVPVAT